MKLILGPCQIQSEDHALYMAQAIKEIADKVGYRGVFYKSSFDKANRTSGDTPRGVGWANGLRILQKVRHKTGLRVLTDFHETMLIEMSQVLPDVIQIPAFLCRQTDLLIAAGRSGKTVNIKKGQFMAPKDMQYAIEKVKSTGNEDVWVTERGTCFGYNDLVVDYRGLAVLGSFGVPVIFDATHSAQRPSAGDGRSGGDRSLVPLLARAAVAVGVDGIFAEVHEDPDHAPSDGPNSLHLESLEEFLHEIKAIDDLRR